MRIVSVVKNNDMRSTDSAALYTLRILARMEIQVSLKNASRPELREANAHRRTSGWGIQSHVDKTPFSHRLSRMFAQIRTIRIPQPARAQ